MHVFVGTEDMDWTVARIYSHVMPNDTNDV